MPTAPTLVASSFGTTTSGATAPSGTVSWQTGDVVVCIYGNAGASPANMATPTNTGSGLSWTVKQSNAGGSNCGGAVATAVATATSSGIITAGSVAGPSENNFTGVYVFRGASGVGNSAISATTARTVSLTPTAADSAIAWGVFDWNADAVQTLTPAATSHTAAAPGPSATPQRTLVSGQYTYYWAELDDQTSAGAVSYGVGGSTAGPFTIVAVEIQGAAGGGSSLSASPSDAEGITDSAAATVNAVRSQDEPVGITDGVTASLAGASTQTPADPVGITDTATPTQAITRTIADPVGITDTGVTQTIEASVNQDDPVGITDSTAQVMSAARSQGDPVGIADSVTASLGGGSSLTGTPADPEGITDTATSALAAVRTDDDPVGITDAVTAIMSRVVTVDDFLGITDAASGAVQSASSQTIPDPVGITDPIATVSALVRPLTDPVGISDSAVAVLARTLTVTVADSVGITDQAATGQRDITITGSLAPPRISGRLLEPRITGQLED